MAKTKKNNADYWRQRAEAVAEEAHKNADKAVKDAQGFFREAEISTRRQIESWYARFAAENQISLSEAHKRLDARELEEFKWTVDQYIKAAQNGDLSKEWIQKLKNASARVHIDRLEAVLLSIEAELERCYGQYADRTEEHLKDVITEGYTRTCFDTQQGVGVGWDIAGIDSAKVDSMIRKPWTTDSKTFRDRVWQDKDQLVNYVHKDLTQAILRGDSLRKVTDRMSERLQVPKHKAARLIHTETTYFNAQAAKESYAELGVDEVQIIGTLDNLTCPECGGMDHQVVPVNRMEPGVSVPPFHPNCRCTTAPVDEFADEFDTRVARKEDGETYEIPANMSYEEWKEKFVDGGSKEGLASLDSARFRSGAEVKEEKVEIVDQEEGEEKAARIVMGRDITKSFLRDAEPMRGNIDYEDGYPVDERQDEIETAKILHRLLGGSIKLKAELQGQKNPDYEWLGALWDLKSVSTEKAVNSAVKSGMAQIRANPGGVILNFGNRSIDLDEMRRVLNLRMSWYPDECADIVIIINGRVKQVLRY